MIQMKVSGNQVFLNFWAYYLTSASLAISCGIGMFCWSQVTGVQTRALANTSTIHVIAKVSIQPKGYIHTFSSVYKHG